MIKFSIFLFTTLFCFSAFAFGLQVDKEVRTQKEVISFLKETYSLLPQSVRNYGNFKVKIEFERISNDSDINLSCDSENGFIYGKYKKTFKKIKGIKKVQRKIVINKKLLPYIINKQLGQETRIACKHKNIYKMAQATFLHELAHVYDSHTFFTRKVSSKDELKALGFWDLDSWFNKNHNSYHHRSVDSYEYKKKSEFFAVNFEYFILDKNYQCRRPGLYRFLKKSLKHTPYKNTVCDSYRIIEYPSKSGQQSFDLTTKNVVAIDFLFASEGKAIMSRFGHSMLRLITCPKGETNVDLCRKKGNNHLIIGFLAHLEDFKINNYKGLTGQYPSELTIRSMLETKMAYNQSELRDLVSVPLNLGKNNRQRFLDQLLRIYWEYKGQYFFFTNNCASEAWKLLQIAFNKKELYKKDFLTPLGLYKYLIDSDLIINQKEKPKETLLREGFLYESFHKKLQQTYEVLFKYKEIQNLEKYENYIKLDHSTRNTFIKNIVTKSIDKRELYALYAMENRASYEYGESLIKKIERYTDTASPESEIFTLLKELKAKRNEYSFGARSFNQGYGIPLNIDFTSQENVSISTEGESEKEILEKIKKHIKKEFGSDIGKTDEIQNNKNLILNALSIL